MADCSHSGPARWGASTAPLADCPIVPASGPSLPRLEVKVQGEALGAEDGRDEQDLGRTDIAEWAYVGCNPRPGRD